MHEQIHNRAALFANLPEPLQSDRLQEIRQFHAQNPRSIIVLDDDPTGTQTVSNIPVLTRWDEAVIATELRAKTALFFILTNSRSLPTDQAEALAETIGQNIWKASAKTDRKPIVISRSDSTLRGHYPAEVDALAKELHLQDSIELLVPAFFEGGRYTIGDIHYVAEGETLVPAAQTPFAKDKAFGYRSSQLAEWILEKRAAEFPSQQVSGISLSHIRSGEGQDLREFIQTMPDKQICFANAANDRDLQQLALACLQSNRDILYRTAASFVSALAGQEKKALLRHDELVQSSDHGGLMVVGSYVPKTTRQLQFFLSQSSLHCLEVDVKKVLTDQAILPAELARFGNSGTSIPSVRAE
ncbi:MAG: four-carbon acid sugar kinase family protein [Bacteroidota bacterium]